MKILSKLLCLISLFSTPALAAEPSPSPSLDPVTVYRIEAHSPEFMALSQVAYPLGLGYFLQDEADLGGLYLALQGGMLLGGTLWGTRMGGSSWTQILPNLSLGLWLMSLAHVDALARAKNARLAQDLKLSPEQVRALQGAYPFGSGLRDLSEPSWEAKLGLPLLLAAGGDRHLAVSAAPGLQLNYPLGAWLQVYTSEAWLENLDLSLELQGLVPLWSSLQVAVPSPPEQMQTAQKEATDSPGTDLFNAPGLSSSFGLVYRTPGPVAWYVGAGWTALWRSLFSNQATWSGVTAQGGLSLELIHGLQLKLGLQLGFLGFSSGMTELPALIRVQPEVSGIFVF
jgi:hypothetical protein